MHFNKFYILKSSLLFISLLLFLSTPNQLCFAADKENFTLINAIERDTTGNGFKDKIQIMADEKNQGYILDILQHNGKAYKLRGDNKNNKFLAPYSSFMKLNLLVADVNHDKFPEIITYGSLTHENSLYFFKWDGKQYKIIFYGFYTRFEFKDITNDGTPELVVHNRIYGSGDETIYYQWQKNKYTKIYYDLDSGRGFDRIKELLVILNDPSLPDDSYKDTNYFNTIFSKEATSDCINYIKKLKTNLLSIQISQYIDEKLTWNTTVSDSPIEDKWRFKVLTYRIDGTKVVPSVRLLEVKTTAVGNKNNIYKISSFKIEPLK